MKIPARIPFAVLIVACVVILLIGVVRVVRESTPARVRMTDGTMLYIRGVYFGTNEITTDTPIKKLVRRILPQNLSTRWLDAPVTSHGGDTNQLHLAFVRTDATGKKLADFWSKVETIDSKGAVYTDSPGASIMGNNDLLEFSLTAFPRRDERFLVRMYDMNGTFRAEFMVKNPLLSREFPVWKPEPLPQTKTNNGARVTLKGLKSEKSDYGSYCVPNFHIESDDPGWRSGKHMYHTFTDATGNSGSFLSTNEPAWHIHVALFRPATAKFPSNVVWKLPLVKIPAALSSTNLNLSNTLDGVKIWVPAICGPGTMTISNFTNVSVAAPIFGHSGWSTSERAGNTRIDRHSSVKTFAVVETLAFGNESELVLQFIGADGKVLKSEHRGGWIGTTDPKRGAIRRHTVELLDTNAQTAALEIKLNRPLDFEFMIDPREIKTK